jgi:hypothetical protein
MPFELSLTDSPSQRRAKIVATLGPASNTEPVFRELVRAGVDVVRLNFSHGAHEEKTALIQMIRKVSREERKPLCILGDLQGPKIRTSKLKDHHAVLLKAGGRLTITPRDVPGTASLVGTTFKTLAENVEQGSRILLSDGLIELRVHDVDGDDLVCEIINGGMLGENKGINLPGIAVRVPSLTDKDSTDRDCRFVCAHGGGCAAGAESGIGVRQRNLDHRQAGEAAGHRAPGRDSHRGRRHHGGARRPGRRSAAGKGAGDSEVHHQARQRVSQAGDHGDANA